MEIAGLDLDIYQLDIEAMIYTVEEKWLYMETAHIAVTIRIELDILTIRMYFVHHMAAETEVDITHRETITGHNA